MLTGLALVFVSSNQSAATGLLPLDQGATSEMMIAPAADVCVAGLAESIITKSVSTNKLKAIGRRMMNRNRCPPLEPQL
jgi:hypothetical protein